MGRAPRKKNTPDVHTGQGGAGRPGEADSQPAFARAFAKSQLAGGAVLPRNGSVFVSVKDADKLWIEAPVRLLLAQGFRIVATTGAHAHLSGLGLEVTPVRKVLEGSPHILDAMKNREIALVVNTPEGRPPPAPRPRPRRSPSRRRARRTCARCRATRRGDGAAA